MNRYAQRVGLVMLVLGIIEHTNGPSIAQGQAIPDLCSVALRDGIRDSKSVYTDYQQLQTLQTRLCSIHTDSYQEFTSQATGFGISLPLAEGLLGLNGSDQSKSGVFKSRFDSYCSTLGSTSSLSDVTRVNSATVSKSLIDSWDGCVSRYFDTFARINQWGVFVEVTPYSDASKFTVRVRARTGRAGPLEINEIQPFGDVTCVDGSGNNVARGRQYGTSDFAMTCAKAADLSVPFSVTLTDGLSNQVQVPARKSTLDDVMQQLGLLKQQVMERKNLSQRDNRFQLPLADLKSPPWSAVGDCDHFDLACSTVAASRYCRGRPERFTGGILTEHNASQFHVLCF